MSKRSEKNETEIDNSSNKKYKISDIILVENEYCIGCDFYDRKEYFTRWYVDTKCPFCDEKIEECLGLESDYYERITDNKIDLIRFFDHLRKFHDDNFICLKNINSDIKKKIIKFTLVKKVIL